MQREKLLALSLENLISLAEEKKIELDFSDEGKVDLEEVVDQILEALEEEREEIASSSSDAMLIKGKKYIVSDDDFELVRNQDLVIPERYNETQITVLVRDPEWAFAYWDLKDKDLEFLEKEGINKMFLRVTGAMAFTEGGSDDEESFDIPIKTEDRSWYINLTHQGYRYTVELRYKKADEERMLARSNVFTAPVGAVADSENRTILDKTDELIGLSGLTRIGESAYSKIIPQRIISLMTDKYMS